MQLDLTNKRALVCGSSQGIGWASAKMLAACGANVTLLARNEAKLEKAVKELPVHHHQEHHFFVADFSKPEELRTNLDNHLSFTKNEYHILVNNTGGPPGGPITEASTDAFLAAFGQHLICNHILATALLPQMKKLGYGRIINIISTSVKQPLNNLGVSNTVRGAVANWAKTWANEVGQFNITVNNILPGATKTERLSSIISNKASKNQLKEQEVEEEMKSEVPMRRFAEPEDVAAAVVFLASPLAGYINGVNLPVDGGRTGSL